MRSQAHHCWLAGASQHPLAQRKNGAANGRHIDKSFSIKYHVTVHPDECRGRERKVAVELVDTTRVELDRAFDVRRERPTGRHGEVRMG